MSNIKMKAVRALSIMLLASVFSHGARSQQTNSKKASDQKVLAEVLAQQEKLSLEARHGDINAWGALITDDYTEFDPYYVFMLEARKDLIVDMQKAWDLYDKLPSTLRSHTARTIQVYGDVAVLTTTSVAKGDPVSGGFMKQGKSTMVYVKLNGTWVLTHCHDGRRAGLDGIPID